MELGGNLTCVVGSSGDVRCFGQSSSGQIPEASGAQGVTTLSVTDTRQLAVGSRQVCALDGSGVTRCWGEGGFGALGRGPASGVLTPEPISVPSGGATFVATGFRHTCVAQGDELYCFGIDGSGQVGAGSALVQRTPRRVSLRDQPTQVSAGQQSTCALLTSQGIECWGEGSFGRLGYGSATDSSAPETVIDMGNRPLLGMFDLSVGQRNACALSATATLCWGSANVDQLGNSVSLESNSRAIAVGTPGSWTDDVELGDRFACWLTNNGETGCVGRNNDGQLGRTCTSPCGDYAFATEAGIASPTFLAVGGRHTCIANSTDVECWGSSMRDQVGAGSFSLGSLIVSLDAGVDTTCAALEDGSVACWGDNRGRQVLNTEVTGVSVATAVTGVESASDVAVGDQFACALRNDGVVVCWGDDTFGQLGRASRASGAAAAPVSLPSGANAIALTAGDQHACAIVEEGGMRALYCWGSDRHGRLGIERELVLPDPTLVRVPGDP
ncbi:MAG: RCC1 domain-containing protein [Sandaracinaceae bacterium]